MGLAVAVVLRRMTSGRRSTVPAQSIAQAFDLKDNGLMKQTIAERGGDDGIAVDVSPLGEAALRGHDH
jgi:hypothetical protein